MGSGWLPPGVHVTFLYACTPILLVSISYHHYPTIAAKLFGIVVMVDLRVLWTLITYVGVMAPPLLIWPVLMTTTELAIPSKFVASGLAVGFAWLSGTTTSNLFLGSPPAGLRITRNILVGFTALLSGLFMVDLMYVSSFVLAPMGVTCSIVAIASLHAACMFWTQDGTQNEEKSALLVSSSKEHASREDGPEADRRVPWIFLTYFFVVAPPLIIWSDPFPPFWHWRLNATVAALKVVSLGIAFGILYLAGNSANRLFLGSPPTGLSLSRNTVAGFIAGVVVLFALDGVSYWSFTAAQTFLVYFLVMFGNLQSACVFWSKVGMHNEQEKDAWVPSTQPTLA